MKEIEEKILRVTEKLIEVESVSSKPKKLKEVIDVVENYFLNRGLEINRYIKNDKHSIVISNTREKKKRIILNAHLDVVDADSSLFKMTRNNDIITGRGAFDMKTFAAMLMIATEDIIKKRPDLSIGLIFTTDEEIGGRNGMEFLIKEKGYSADLAYIPDGGGHFNILTEEKGLLVLKITAHGKTAHSAYLWRGCNANVKLINLYNKILKEFPLPKKDTDWCTSISLSRIEGGNINTLNKVPDKAEMYLDIRFPYPKTADSIVSSITNIINGDTIDVEKVIDGITFYTHSDNRYIQEYKQIAKKYLDRNISFTKSPGAADARFLSEKKIPVIMTRCEGGGLHRQDEWISIPKLLQQYEMLMIFLETL